MKRLETTTKFTETLNQYLGKFRKLGEIMKGVWNPKAYEIKKKQEATRESIADATNNYRPYNHIKTTK